MKWNSPISNLAYMFENLETITYVYINYMPWANNAENNINMTKMFYNCKSLTNIILDIDYNNYVNVSAGESYYYNYPDDLSYAFYNCTSLVNLELKYNISKLTL